MQLYWITGIACQKARPRKLCLSSIDYSSRYNGGRDALHYEYIRGIYAHEQISMRAHYRHAF